jgi:hypothetical protein
MRYSLNNMKTKSLDFLLRNKLVRVVLIALAVYFIYKFGKGFGEFMYYITH